MIQSWEQFGDLFAAYPLWRCFFPWYYAELGRRAEAQAELARLLGGDLSALRRDHTWLCGIATLAEAVALVGDATRAATLFDLLRPYAQRNIGNGLLLHLGAGGHFLGLLASTMGEWDAAAGNFDAALTMKPNGANTRVSLPCMAGQTSAFAPKHDVTPNCSVTGRALHVPVKRGASRTSSPPDGHGSPTRRRKRPTLQRAASPGGRICRAC
jgi:hypothetical protein